MREHSSCLITDIEEFYRVTLLNPPNFIYPWQYIVVTTLEQVILVLRPQFSLPLSPCMHDFDFDFYTPCQARPLLLFTDRRTSFTSQQESWTCFLGTTVMCLFSMNTLN